MTERPDQSVITSPRSARVRSIAALAGRSARRKQGLFRVEGPQSVRSLLAHRPDLAQTLYLTEHAAGEHPELPDLAARAGIPVQQVQDHIVRAMVREAEAGPGQGAVSPQGVIAIARLPAEDPAQAAQALAALPAHGPATAVVLHEVRDPGNVGTLIRTADAAGADLVILTRTSTDPFSPKAVRAATGSLFHLPVVTGADAPALLRTVTEHAFVTAATSGYAETELFDIELPERIAWILGNEAHGLDPATLEGAQLQVRIPLAGLAESLNVHTAATVCLYETLRQRRKSR